MTEGAVRAGSAVVDVTPESAVPLMGYYGEDRISTGAHDPLYARAVALSDGETTVGISTLDVLMSSRRLHRHVSERLEERGTEFDEVLVGATHTHSGPVLPPEWQDFDVGGFAAFGDAHERAIEDAYDEIRSGVVDGLAEAYDSMAPATLRRGSATNHEATMNRRSWGGHLGNVRTDPDDDPYADVDPELKVLTVEREDARFLVVNFACHPLCISRHESLLSADYPSVVYDRFDRRDDVDTVLFLNGAAGDVAPRDIYDWDSRLGNEFEYMERVGRSVAETAADAYERSRAAPPMEGVRIRTARRDVSLPLRALDRADLEAERSRLEADLERVLPTNGAEAIPPSHRALITRKKRNITHVEDLLDLQDWKESSNGGGETVPARMAHVAIGDASVLSVPGELFVRHGLDFKDAAASDLMVAGYTNGYLGYLPTGDDFDRSGYEVQTCRLAPRAIEKIREAAFELVADR